MKSKPHRAAPATCVSPEPHLPSRGLFSPTRKVWGNDGSAAPRKSEAGISPQRAVIRNRRAGAEAARPQLPGQRGLRCRLTAPKCPRAQQPAPRVCAHGPAHGASANHFLTSRWCESDTHAALLAFAPGTVLSKRQDRAGTSSQKSLLVRGLCQLLAHIAFWAPIGGPTGLSSDARQVRGTRRFSICDVFKLWWAYWGVIPS